ncbi:MAG: DUF5330 domain-containing protein [Bauldia sp.]|nr:DUF5330 domain-containing protein [Bauldia sp.]
MFVLRSVFWLTVVILLLPADPNTGEAPRSAIIEAVMSARSSVAGLSGFCTRNPDVCMTGGAAIDLVAEKAEDGVELIYDLIDGGGPDPSGAESQRGTLTTDDLALPWRGGGPDDRV